MPFCRNPYVPKNIIPLVIINIINYGIRLLLLGLFGLKWDWARECMRWRCLIVGIHPTRTLRKTDSNDYDDAVIVAHCVCFLDSSVIQHSTFQRSKTVPESLDAASCLSTTNCQFDKRRNENFEELSKYQ